MMGGPLRDFSTRLDVSGEYFVAFLPGRYGPDEGFSVSANTEPAAECPIEIQRDRNAGPND
jgi:hypothetical protein